MTLTTNATLSSSHHFNAGTWTITPSAAIFSSGSSSNYTITYANASTGLTVTQQELTITTPSGTLISGTNKVYDGTTNDQTITGIPHAVRLAVPSSTRCSWSAAPPASPTPMLATTSR